MQIILILFHFFPLPLLVGKVGRFFSLSMQRNNYPERLSIANIGYMVWPKLAIAYINYFFKGTAFFILITVADRTDS